MAAKNPGTFEYKIAARNILVVPPKSGDSGAMEYKIAGKNLPIYVAAAGVFIITPPVLDMTANFPTPTVNHTTLAGALALPTMFPIITPIHTNLAPVLIQPVGLPTPVALIYTPASTHTQSRQRDLLWVATSRKTGLHTGQRDTNFIAEAIQ